MTTLKKYCQYYHLWDSNPIKHEDHNERIQSNAVQKKKKEKKETEFSPIKSFILGLASSYD